MYEYKLESIKRVYDGDTVTCRVDLGFGVTKDEKFRLSKIDAPELRGDTLIEARISRDWLIKRLDDALTAEIPVIVKTQKDRKGKYGRYLAEFFINDISINDEMVRLGYATFY